MTQGMGWRRGSPTHGTCAVPPAETLAWASIEVQQHQVAVRPLTAEADNVVRTGARAKLKELRDGTAGPAIDAGTIKLMAELAWLAYEEGCACLPVDESEHHPHI